MKCTRQPLRANCYCCGTIVPTTAVKKRIALNFPSAVRDHQSSCDQVAMRICVVVAYVSSNRARGISSLGPRLPLTHSAALPGLIEFLRKLKSRLAKETLKPVKTITPARLARTRGHQGIFTLKITTPTAKGFKALARKGSLSQEVFFVGGTRPVIARAITAELLGKRAAALSDGDNLPSGDEESLLKSRCRKEGEAAGITRAAALIRGLRKRNIIE